MKTDGSVILDTSLDNTGLEKDFKETKKVVDKNTKSTKKLGDEFKETGKKGKTATKDIKAEMSDLNSVIADVGATLGLSFGLDALTGFAGAALDAASDLQEVQNVVDTAFGDMAGQVNQFSQTAIERFGMSELAAKQTAGKYMSMATAMGISGQAATDMSLRVTGLTGDMASFYNVSQDVASTALASIWTGETESLKQFGIVMTQTNLEQFAMAQGINKTWQELTQAEQVQLRYNYVLEQTNLAQGDFEKTQDSWANQNRILSETFQALKADIGTGLMETLTPALEVINGIVGSLADFQDKTGLLDDFFVILLGGIGGLAAMKAIDVIHGLATAMKAMGTATFIAHASAGLAAGAFGLLAGAIFMMAGAWDSMTGMEKAVAVLGALTAAGFAAATAMGAFHSAATMGAAAIAIVGGITAILIAVNSAQKRAERYAATAEQYNVDTSKFNRMTPPKAARGAVIPPNSEFMAIYGDQHSGRNLETPEALMRQIVREESGGGSVNVRFTGTMAQLIRAMKPEIEREGVRSGTPLAGGSTL